MSWFLIGSICVPVVDAFKSVASVLEAVAALSVEPAVLSAALPHLMPLLDAQFVGNQKLFRLIPSWS